MGLGIKLIKICIFKLHVMTDKNWLRISLFRKEMTKRKLGEIEIDFLFTVLEYELSMRICIRNIKC